MLRWRKCVNVPVPMTHFRRKKRGRFSPPSEFILEKNLFGRFRCIENGAIESRSDGDVVFAEGKIKEFA